MSRKVPLILGSLVVYGFATYIIYNSVQLYRLPNLPEGLPVSEDVSDRYERTAEHFDQDVDFTEKLIGMGWLRQRLTRKASGHVLEVSVGTGRNAAFYNLKGCKSIAMIDQSKEMVKIAREKFNGKAADVFEILHNILVLLQEMLIFCIQQHIQSTGIVPLSRNLLTTK